MTNLFQDISIPSYNPSSKSDKSGTYEFLFDKLASQIQKVIPAKILNYDREKNRAEVQILAQRITSTGGKMEEKPLVDIPVCILGAGGFGLGFPIQIGTIGFLLASDRNISVFKQLLDIFVPATYQKHKYADSIFIPLLINGFTISENDINAVLLSSVDGETKISLMQGQITMTAETITCNGNTTINGDLTVSNKLTAGTVEAGNGVTGTFTNSTISTKGIVTGGS